MEKKQNMQNAGGSDRHAPLPTFAMPKKGLVLALPPTDLAHSTEGRGSLSGNMRKQIGAGDEIRTHDPNLGKVMLYP